MVRSLTRAAIFLVVQSIRGPRSRDAVRSFCAISALLRAVGFRDIEGDLSCVMGVGSDAWTGSSAIPDLRTCIRSVKSGQDRDMPFHAR